MFVITGGGSGIGRALAQRLASKNHEVLIIGRRESFLKHTAQCSSLINYLQADIATEEGRAQVVNYLYTKKTITALIHNAGTIEPITSIATLDEQAWQHVFDVNVNASLFLTQRLLSKLISGRVLNIGSGAAYFPIVGWSAYCVSKAALAMLTQCWQLEYGQYIDFASVMPGIIDTEMQEVIRKADSMEEKKQLQFKAFYQEKRLLSSATVALFLSWLLLDIEREKFVEKEWDIYDKSHHSFWLEDTHKVPDVE